MNHPYEIQLQLTGQNISKEGLYSVIDTSRSVVLKSELLAKDANLFIENLTLLEETYAYISKKQLDATRFEDPANHNYGHNLELLALRLERQINTFKKIEDNNRAQALIKKLESFRTTQNALPLLNRLHRAYNLLKSL